MISNIKTDYCTPILTFTNNYKVTIPTRDDWNNLIHLKVNSINIFTHGSKSDDKAGGGVFLPELQIETSFRLPDHCTVYQAEVMAIVEAMKLWQSKRPREQNIFLFSDNQAALKALDSSFTNSKTIAKSRKSLIEMATHYRFHLIWVPAHRDIVKQL